MLGPAMRFDTMLIGTNLPIRQDQLSANFSILLPHVSALPLLKARKLYMAKRLISSV